MLHHWVSHLGILVNLITRYMQQLLTPVNENGCINGLHFIQSKKTNTLSLNNTQAI